MIKSHKTKRNENRSGYIVRSFGGNAPKSMAIGCIRRIANASTELQLDDAFDYG